MPPLKDKLVAKGIPLNEETSPKAGKPYVKPAIIHELVLETRAGCPLNAPGQFNPFNTKDPFNFDPLD
jgi:hypothetical protein